MDRKGEKRSLYVDARDVDDELKNGKYHWRTIVDWNFRLKYMFSNIEMELKVVQICLS